MNKNIRVLFVEDSEDDLIILSRELTRAGYVMSSSRVETEAAMRQALSAGEWDIIISDYFMPRFSGIAALKVLSESGLDIPFIIVSGKIGEDTAVEAMRAGAHDYLLKGNLGRLVPAVERELREASSRRERRQAEEALRESERKFAAVAETATDAIVMMDHLGNVSYWNPSAEKIFGYTREEALGRPLHLFLSDERYHSQFLKGFNRFVETGEGPAVGVTIEFLALRKDGVEFPVEVSLSALRVRDNWHSVGIIRDITERKRAEEELRRHRDNLEELVSERTNELRLINEKLHDEINERMRVEAELRRHRDHLDILVKERTGELSQTNRELRAEIMRRIQMERDLIESQKFIRRIADATPNILYLYDVIDQQNVYVNPSVKELLGYTPEEVRRMGAFFLNILHPDDASVLESLTSRFNKAKDGDVVESEYRLQNSGGEWRWFHSRDVVFKRTSDGALRSILGIAQDVTERRKAEEELKSSREQLRLLLAHLQTVREDERTKISREIHDELGQALTALKMDVSWLIKRLDKGQKDLLEKARLMSKLIDMNIQTVKRISAELRPGLLDHLGLAAALEWQAEEFQSRSGINCGITLSPGDIKLDKNVSTTVFRVFQETLTNVLRHAGASKVRVRLEKKSGELVLKVADNGKGISEKQISSPKSIGLIGMRERVGFLGGKVRITGEKNKGTTITVSIPVEGDGITSKPAGGK